MNLEQLTQFFGIMTIINIVLLMVSAILVVVLKDFIANLHTKLFDIKPEIIPPMVYGYLGIYKIFIFIFNIVPYMALKMIS